MKFKNLGLLLLIIFMAAIAIFAQQIAETGDDKKSDSTNAISAGADTADSQSGRELKAVVYYFYTDYRCPSCIKIEAFSKEAIDSGFVDQLQQGQLQFLAVNTDRKENEHFVDDYQLYTKSLIVAKVINGVPAKGEIPDGQNAWKNLTKVWELLGNKEEFTKYVQTEVQVFMAGN